MLGYSTEGVGFLGLGEADRGEGFMRLLFYQWNSYLQYDIEWICREKNIELKPFSWTFQN